MPTITPAQALAKYDGSFSIAYSPHALLAAHVLAESAYQSDLLNGRQSLSGSTLKGKAFQYAASYAKSRARLLERMTAAGIEHSEVIGPRGKRILVIGATVKAEG